MDMDANQIASIVRSVLSSVNEPQNTTSVPDKAHVAMLTAPRNFEVKEFPIPEIGDDDILVKVEGCGVCGTDVHEWKGDPFGFIPLVLGHEGTGEVVKLGKNVKVDSQGHEIKVGDKLVTSVICCNHCYNCLHHPEAPNLCENQGIYGLITDNEKNHLCGWFSDYMRITKGSHYLW